MKTNVVHILSAWVLFPLAFAHANLGGDSVVGIVPTRLQCDFRAEPLGVDSRHPQLEWILEAIDPRAHGLAQSAYQILAASSPMLLNDNRADLWDSGKVRESRNSGIYYAGTPLTSDQIVWWKVRLWDQVDEASAWSKPTKWTMGVLEADAWHSNWISTPPGMPMDESGTILLRREFTVKPRLKNATLSICGLGQYEASINGRPITADIMTPGWTEYDKTCLYDTYDITATICEGHNAVGVLLGSGMYNVQKVRYAKFERSFGPLKAIVRIRLEYTDGSLQFIGTGPDWRVGESPMTFSSVYGGEDWDSRRVQKGWDRPGFNDENWPAAAISHGPGGTLKGTSHGAPPIRRFEVLTPINRSELRPNVFIYDFGRQGSMMPRLKARGTAGSMIRVTPSELLEPNGSLFCNNYNGKAWSQYFLSGADDELYSPKFYYCGHRYLQVEALPSSAGGAVPQLLSINDVVIHSTIIPAGEFTCSNEMLNRIFAIIHTAELSNMMSVITDCPHRERLGWLEQDHLHGPSFRYCYDMRSLVAKTIGDMEDCQQPDGLVPNHVPEYPVYPSEWRDSIEWGSSSVLLPWQQYQWTGDVEALREDYPLMKHYVDYLTSKATYGIAAQGLGDWSGQGPSRETPPALIATAIYYQDVTVIANTARLLGWADDASHAEDVARNIRNAFNKAYFHRDTNQYGTGSQCADAMALSLGLATAETRNAVAAHLVADLERRGYEMTVGEIGLPYLLRALAEAKRSDVVFALALQSKHPGYAYQVESGATALCETWDAAHDNSQNQFMLGHIIEWFFSDLAGIQLDPASPGFGHIVIKPSFVGDLSEVKASYTSVRGTIRSEWKRRGRVLTLHVVVPPNVTATIVIPTPDSQSVTEGGNPISTVSNVMQISSEGSAAYSVGSGDYTFAASLP